MATEMASWAFCSMLGFGRALQCGPALKRCFVLLKEDLVLYCTPSPGGWAVLCVSFCIWKVKGQWSAGWRMWKDRIGCSSFMKAEAMVTSGVGDMQTLISFMTGVQVGHNNGLWSLSQIGRDLLCGEGVHSLNILSLVNSVQFEGPEYHAGSWPSRPRIVSKNHLCWLMPPRL